MVVFFDVDGTIIDNKTQVIPESTVHSVLRMDLRLWYGDLARSETVFHGGTQFGNLCLYD